MYLVTIIRRIDIRSSGFTITTKESHKILALFKTELWCARKRPYVFKNNINKDRHSVVTLCHYKVGNSITNVHREKDLPRGHCVVHSVDSIATVLAGGRDGSTADQWATTLFGQQFVFVLISM